MNNLIAKTNIALNILRPNNNVLLYDDGDAAYFMYDNPRQTGGGLSPLKYPSWRSFEMIPSQEYQYNKEQFFQRVSEIPTPKIGMLYAGWEQNQDGGSLLFALKSPDQKEEIVTGQEALDRYHQAGGLREDYQMLQRLSKNLRPKSSILTHEDELRRIIKTAKDFTRDSAMTLEMFQEPPTGQIGGGADSPYSWTESEALLTVSEWDHCDQRAYRLITSNLKDDLQVGGQQNSSETVSESAHEYHALEPISNEHTKRFDEAFSNINHEKMMGRLMNSYFNVPTFKTLDTSETQA